VGLFGGSRAGPLGSVWAVLGLSWWLWVSFWLSGGSRAGSLGCVWAILGLYWWLWVSFWGLLGSSWAPLCLLGCLLALFVDLYRVDLGILWLHLAGIGCCWLLLIACGLFLGRFLLVLS